MGKLEVFLSYLCGEFNNDDQVNKEIEEGEIKHPKAKHITGICNDKIKNLPDDFEGFFVIEESYYEQGKFKNILPHLFLFTEDSNGNVVLTSYDLPSRVSKEDFRNDNKDLIMDYNELRISEKFTPMTYTFKDNGFEGESISHFTPETTFKLKERTENGILYVSEIFEKNGKVTFGFVEPIIYKKIK
ncbi:hypothetical protein [Clostridium perfringens]|uniref:hypothetical protein n=1 Tax=Clostridium perfringens TaxID=1502 RepID=UPI000BBA7C60|nr:hypothetical protein [Clostridium perfringens]MDM0489560.1 hypothetical protein [Clostridium perfringens]